MTYDARGYHVVADITEIENEEYLSSIDMFKMHLETAAQLAGGTIVGFESYQFEDGGFSAALILAESHLTVHTNPKAKSLAFDVFMCGDKARPKAALIYLCNVLKGQTQKVLELVRDPQMGMGSDPQNIMFNGGRDTHLIVELVSVKPALAQDMGLSLPAMLNSVSRTKKKTQAMHLKSFGKQYGYSGALLLDKGHLTMHTWPETGFISMDLYVQDQLLSKGEVSDLVQTLTFDLNCGFTDLLVLYRG